MWFEILPSAAIIYVGFNLSWMLMYGLHKLTLDNAYRRDMRWSFDRALYVRDRSLTDNPYLRNGLEQISDENDDSCECKCKRV